MSKGKVATQKLTNEYGIDDPTGFPLDLIVFGRGATIIEKFLGKYRLNNIIDSNGDNSRVLNKIREFNLFYQYILLI